MNIALFSLNALAVTLNPRVLTLNPRAVTLNLFQGPCLYSKTGARWMLKRVQHDGNGGARDMLFHPHREGVAS